MSGVFCGLWCACELICTHAHEHARPRACVSRACHAHVTCASHMHVAHRTCVHYAHTRVRERGRARARARVRVCCQCVPHTPMYPPVQAQRRAGAGSGADLTHHSHARVEVHGTGGEGGGGYWCVAAAGGDLSPLDRGSESTTWMSYNPAYVFGSDRMEKLHAAMAASHLPALQIVQPAPPPPACNTACFTSQKKSLQDQWRVRRVSDLMKNSFLQAHLTAIPPGFIVVVIA